MAAGLAIIALLLSACATPTSVLDVVGPAFGGATTGEEQRDAPRLDVIIPVFDPGLPPDSDDYEKQSIWPELRRTEANRFALNMKSALEDTQAFGAVRVAPNRTATGDLYVLGSIKKSNGEDVSIQLDVVDISGKQWHSKTYKHRVKEAFHEDLRNKGKDPYQPLFTEAAEDIVKLLRKKTDKQLAELTSTSEIRFAASLSHTAFGQHLEQKGNVITLASLPDENDPMLARTRAIRVRDQLFIDRLQTHYEAFDSRINSSYVIWQKESLTETKAARLASRKAMGQTILGGALLVLGSIAAANTKRDSTTAADVAAIGGLVGGAVLVAQSFRTREEMRVHRDALAELGESIHVELAPKVVKFENETVELTGTADEQFAQWRSFLQHIYEQEKTPDIQL